MPNLFGHKENLLAFVCLAYGFTSYICNFEWENQRSLDSFCCGGTDPVCNPSECLLPTGDKAYLLSRTCKKYAVQCILKISPQF